MKKTILTVVVAMAGLAVASAQGTVKFFNITSAYLISTNGTGIADGQNGLNGTTTGKMSTTPNAYYFALLVSQAAPTSTDPLTGGWSIAKTGGVDMIGNNYTSFAGGINGPGSASGTTVDNWVPGTSQYIELVGWSASLGTTWTSITQQLTAGNWDASGYFGVSSFGQIVSGGAGTPATSPSVLFSSTGIPSGFNLNGVSPVVVPEPATMALGALGGAALLLFRRRK